MWIYCHRSLQGKHLGIVQLQDYLLGPRSTISQGFLKHLGIESNDFVVYFVIYYCVVIMGMIASQITSLMIVYSTVYSDADQRKHQNSASLAFVQGIHREPVNTPPNNLENVSFWWHHEKSNDMISWKILFMLIFLIFIIFYFHSFIFRL